LFVYGTLLSNNRQGPTYLKDARRLGEFNLLGYALYDLSAYPGIVAGNDTVKGELYAVSPESLADIDRYEGEGSLYQRKTVEVYNAKTRRLTRLFMSTSNPLPVK